MSYAKRCEENDNVPAACESTAVIPSITLADGEALVLRTCRQDMTSHDDFTWPNSGPVAAPDWRKDGECGHGLHGLLWGIGDGGLLNWAEDAIWLAVKVKAAECQNLDGKVKYPAGEVVYCGKREEAVELIMRHLPDAGMKAGMVCGITGATGDRGSASATDRGYILLGRWDDKAKRQRVVVLYPGEDGIKPNTWYRLDDSGKPMELAPLKEGWQDRVRESGESISEGTS